MTGKPETTGTCRSAILPPLSAEDPEEEKNEPEAGGHVTAERIDDAMKENAHTAPDQADHRARRDTPAERSGKAKTDRPERTPPSPDGDPPRRQTELYLDQLGKWDLLTEFWEDDQLSMAGRLTVDPGDDIPVAHKDSTVIKV